MFDKKILNLNHQNNERNTALCLAVSFGLENVVKRLLEKKANINCNNPLQIAIRNGFTNLVILLLRNGANLNLEDGNANNALQYAIQEGKKDIIFVLLDFAKDKTPKNFVPKIDKEILDINHCNEFGDTALHLSVTKKYKDVIKRLLEEGADSNILNNSYIERSCLHIAIEHDDYEIVQLLLVNGANMNCLTGRDGNNALQVALKTKNETLALLLLDLAE